MATSTTGKVDPIVEMSGWRREMQAKRIKFDDEQKQAYCKALAETGLKTVAAYRAGVATTTVYAHLKNDPDFAQAVDEALAIKAAAVVLPIEKSALEGTEESVTHGEGEDAVTRKRIIYETPLRALMLKKFDREGYTDPNAKGDKSSGHGGGGVLIVPMVMTMEEWNVMWAPKDAPPPVEDLDGHPED